MNYFRPLRRKIGIAALLLACMFTACWIRSLTFEDFVDGWLTRHSTIHLISSNSSLNLAYAWNDGGEPNVIQVNGTPVSEALLDSSKPLDWKTFPVEDGDVDYFAWDWDFCGLSFAANDHDPIHKRAVRISNVYFVAPLALLSAWLMLGKLHRTSDSK